MITAVDQDKGRPRGIGYTIVSGKPKSAAFVTYPKGATAARGSGSRSCGLHGLGISDPSLVTVLAKEGNRLKREEQG